VRGVMAQEDIDLDELMSLRDIAPIAGLDPSALWRRTQTGKLKYKRIGRSYATTLRWIAESGEKGTTGRPPKQLPKHLRPADSAAPDRAPAATSATGEVAT
jgi:hypothetical protein